MVCGSLSPLKIEFRKECWFESGQGHHAAATLTIGLSHVATVA